MSKTDVQNFLITFAILTATVSPFAVYWINDTYFVDNGKEKQEVHEDTTSFRYYYDKTTNQCFVITYDTFKFKRDVPTSIEKLECTERFKKVSLEIKPEVSDK